MLSSAAGSSPSSSTPTEHTPLLVSCKVPYDEDEFEGIPGASLPSAVFNLLTSVIGAGIMALPATQKQLGVVLGFLAIVLVGLLTDASLEMFVRFSRASKATSYSSVMAASFGFAGRTSLQLCIIVNNLGLLIVYMIIIGDVLSGTASGLEHHTGVFEEWAGGSFWWNGRFFVLLLTAIFVLAPLVSLPRLDSLRYTSAVSTGLAMLFLLITAWIALVKLLRGELEPPRVWPDVDGIFSGLKLFTAIPVVVTAFICHHNVHPISNELDDPNTIKEVNRLTIIICTAVYVATALLGYLLFGESTMPDVLSNFDADLGVPYGRLLSATVRIGYALHLMLVFPLINFSLRLNVDSLLFPSSPPLSSSRTRFTRLTALLLLFIFLCSTIVPNIWTVFQFTGSTAAVCIGFIFPAILALRDKENVATAGDKYVSWFMLVLAVIASVTSLSTNLYKLVLV